MKIYYVERGRPKKMCWTETIENDTRVANVCVGDVNYRNKWRDGMKVSDPKTVRSTVLDGFLYTF